MKFMSCRCLRLSCFFLMMIAARSACSQEIGLEALKSYEGVWDSEFSIMPTDDRQPTQIFTGVVIGKWVVGDKFLEQTGTYELSKSSPPMIIRTMMSFDQKQNRYQYDYFESSGGVQRSYGNWDPDAKTMTSRMTEAVSGNVSTIVADFSKPGIERWVIETKNREGVTLTKIAGTNTRRKGKQ